LYIYTKSNSNHTRK